MAADPSPIYATRSPLTDQLLKLGAAADAFYARYGIKHDVTLRGRTLVASFTHAAQPFPGFDPNALVDHYLRGVNQWEWPSVDAIELTGTSADDHLVLWSRRRPYPLTYSTRETPRTTPPQAVARERRRLRRALAAFASVLVVTALGWTLHLDPTPLRALERELAHRVSVLQRRLGTIIVTKPTPKAPSKVAATKPAKRADAPARARASAKLPANLWVDPASIGRPYGTKVEGLLTFRGNPTRTFYGRGPVPAAPAVAWRYPDRAMCAPSREKGHTYIWCGTGWTGQPAVFERDGRTWVVFGAYDRAVHFVDAATGKNLRPPFYTGDIIKGSVTVDPDGYPIVYSGSRDGYFRAIAFDGPKPRELWRLSAHAVSPTLWNDDWDGSALVLDDYLFVGGENSQVHIARLNRAYGDDGKVRVAPELVFHAPGWDKKLLASVGDRNVSIENSVSVFGNNLFFSNSGGLAQAWDISGLKRGVDPNRTFSFWTGDDTDASVVVDGDGKLYVASEWERHNQRSASVGQLVKLDPRRAAGSDPRLWSFADRKGLKSGIWGTPALYEDLVIAATHTGELVGLDKHTAKVRWRVLLQGKSWPSPVVVDGTLIQGDCGGNLRAFDIRDTRQPPKPLWTVKLGGCIESTPAVWKGRIYVGTRDGYFYALAAGALPAPALRP